MHKLLALAKSIYYTAEVLYTTIFGIATNGHRRQVAIMGRGEGKYNFFSLFKMV